MNKNDGKRKLLKFIAVGGGAVVAGKSLPESWSKPVIDSVMLPAHAATTDDTDSGGIDNTTTTTVAPCDIAGDYCWVVVKSASNTVTTTFTVGDDGGVSIHRENTKNSLNWDGTGSASDGSLGGDFDITAYNSGNGRDRRYVGTIVCNSDSISGTVYDFKNNDTGSPFTASKGACVPV